MCGPGMCHLLLSFFFNDAFRMSICPGKVPRRESGPRTIEAQPLAKSYFLPDLPPPGREAVRGHNPQGKRESPREGSYRANPRGVRASGRGQWDRSPRKPMGPGKFQAPCASLGQFLRQFSPRGQASVLTTRNRGSGRSPAFDFFRGCTWKVQMAN